MLIQNCLAVFCSRSSERCRSFNRRYSYRNQAGTKHKRINYEKQFTAINDSIMKPFRLTLSTEYRRMKIIEKTKKYNWSKDYIIGDQVDNILCEGRIVQMRKALNQNLFP